MSRQKTAGWLARIGLFGCLVVGVVLLFRGMAAGEPVPGNLYTKTLPEATVQLIDPESGTSSGGGSSDVKVAVGDIVLFTMYYAGTPELGTQGINSYLTDYIPPNTEVVGIRFVDANGLTVEPYLPGLASEACDPPCKDFTVDCHAGTSGCVSGQRVIPPGTLAEVYADTGFFYTTDPRLQKTPLDQFITLTNGIQMTVTPLQIGKVDDLVGATAPYYAHNQWDYEGVQLYGSAGGATPFGYGSIVAGPESGYPLTATESGGVFYFDDDPGPWRRIRYPGSFVGVGSPGVYPGGVGRAGVEYDFSSLPAWDVTPANPLPAGTLAVRSAAGALRVGDIIGVEIALRVTGLPIDPNQNAQVNCSEVVGSEESGSAANDNAFATYLGSPNCAYLGMLFTLDADQNLVVGGDHIVYTITAKNLSLFDQSNSVIKLKYYSQRIANPVTNPPATAVADCDGDGFNCLLWDPGATPGVLVPSEQFVATADFTVGGGGQRTAPVYANFQSTELNAINPSGYTVQHVAVIKGTAAVSLSVDPVDAGVAAGTSVAFTGSVTNGGTQAATVNNLVFELPAGWSLAPSSVILNGSAYPCSGTTTVSCTGMNHSLPAGAVHSLAFAVQVPAGASTGLYPFDIWIDISQNTFGTSELYYRKVAQVAVNQPRSDIPALDCPIGSTATHITGHSSEASGAVVHVYFNGIERGTAVVQADGTWDLDVTATGFGELYGGLEIRATAENAPELESRKSTACFVTPKTACSDGLDNDSDGLVDFPADPGCESPADKDETDTVPPECSDGVDNDGNGWIDFPADPACAGPDDNSEDGVNVCTDGVDNDGDGLVDGADPGCIATGGQNEISLPECYNGRDDDADCPGDTNADGMICSTGDDGVDYEADPSAGDPGCHGWFDDDETDFPFPAQPIKPRLLIVFDTSGSMNWYTTSNDFTGSDGTAECNAGNGDQSRIHIVKEGIRQGVANFGNVDWALMRFHQRARAFACPTSNASLGSGGWQGGGAAPCAGFDYGDLLVGFSPDNVNDLVRWMDDASNYPAVDSAGIPLGFDQELRGSGTTPIAGTLGSALTYLQAQQLLDDPQTLPCRSYSVVLVTDGQESCGGDPVAAATALRNAGILTYVIGFATTDASIIDSLNAIAAAGGTTSAVFADNSVDLSTALADIVSASIKTELCDGADNDCDGQVDEDWPELGTSCDNGQLGVCREVGTYICTAAQDGAVCSVEGVWNTPGTEQCGNGLDDDCDGQVDEGCCYGPELCNGRDDYCGSPPYGPYEDGYEDPAIWDLSTHTALPCGTNEGVCQEGTMACVSGVATCQGAVGPDPGGEVCDGLDNDCNGTVDEGILQQCYTYGSGCTGDAGTGFTCEGICQPGWQTCTVGGAGTWDPCQGEVGPGTEICNGVDDDCDGTVDEGLNQQITCGIGACERTVWSCPSGSPVQCVPGSPTSEGTVCDTVDQNCNGVVNDGVPPRPCQSQTNIGGYYCTGQEYCDESGNWVGCDAPEPVPEQCNGADDDCDGNVDNVTGTSNPITESCYSGNPSELTAPAGDCVAGTRTCTAGQWGSCIGQKLPTPEVCDTVDNDCDGELNEGLSRQCFQSNALGTCFGNEYCDATGAWVGCDAPTPAAESCNGVDDDCDGTVDEGVTRSCYPTGLAGCTGDPQSGYTCQGVCATGQEACVQGGSPPGQWSGSCVGYRGPTEPGDEVTCDGLDNDCDGTVDESITRACYTHPAGCTYNGSAWVCTGACQAGVQACQQGGGGTWGACAGDVGPAPEVCDGLDNDCDGQTDEDIAPRPCTASADVGGVTRTCTGFETCTAGVWGSCDAPTPTAEVCDGVDNDCNGQVDDGVAPRACTRQAVVNGQTATCTGTETCVGGSFVGCDAPTPTAEVCDGVDNDCDGFVDNAVPGQASPSLSEACYTGDPSTLGVGACQAGSRTCSGGAFGQCVGQVLPAAEVCDGVDNDCDGFVDNAVPGQASPVLSAACQVSNAFGVCLGSQICTAGGWGACSAATPEAEVCDGVDNNCDGIIDGVTEACYSAGSGCTGDSQSGYTCAGVCHAGIRVCPQLSSPDPGNNAFGACQFEAGPSPEICDGLDNDCDGFVDESDTNSASPMSRVCYGPGYGAGTGCTAPGQCAGVCREGIQVCGDGTPGIWGACQGEVTPALEVCDGSDNDCDGRVDEPEDMPWLGQPCTGNVGICNGVWQCENGVEECVGGSVEPGRCDGRDNDCDGVIDELDELLQDPQYGTPCGSDVGACQSGQLECVGGAWSCQGAVEAAQEVCDGTDNDCDGLVDNQADCPPVGLRDAYCVEGDCRLECDPGSELACPAGFECVGREHEGQPVSVCMPLVGECGGQTCPEGWICQNDQCVDPCEGVSCESWETCRNGYCVDTSCSGLEVDCGPGEFCANHECVPDPCGAADCDPEVSYCRRNCDESGCTARCEPLCGCEGGQFCDAHGTCQPDPCFQVTCGLAERCDPDSGLCEPDPCAGVFCASFERCFEGECVPDPCTDLACPWPYECVVRPGTDDLGETVPRADCEWPEALWEPGVAGGEYLATGGGGCACTAGGGGAGVGWLLLLLGLLWRRRGAARRKGGAR